MMKILFNYLISFIVISILYGRCLRVGTNSQDFNNVENQDESNIQNEINDDKSSVSASNDIKVTTNILQDSKQEFLLPSQAVIDDDSSFLTNVDFPSELTTSVEEVVFTSTDSGVSLKNKIKSQLENEKINDSIQVYNSYENGGDYIVQAEPKLPVSIVVEETLKVEENVSEVVPISSQEEIKKTAPHQHEDIPSFSEWTQKQLAQAEKKKTDHNDTYEKFTKTRGKFRKKNYASPDCGAKIVASNPESVSSSAVLSSLKDEYMLNYCTNRIWFVVELCEAIQAVHLDLANFELFSSSPKDFSVFISHRFPTREWSNVGKFTAQDSRDVQTFNLHPHRFGKYVKVEMHSHYGKEQFCPISWVGVYGTSEYEVLAKEDDRNLNTEDDDGDSFDEEFLMSHKRESPKNLFSSATDAVLSIVKKATAPFMKSEQNVSQAKNSDKIEESEKLLCISPRYIAVCNNCTQGFYNAVFHLLSCESFSLTNLLSTYFVKRTLIHSESCNKYGLDFRNAREGAPFPSNFYKNSDQAINYLTAMLKETTVAALCNTLAVSENKVVVNVTVESTESLKNLTNKKNVCEEVTAISSEPSLDVSSTKSSYCNGECLQSIQPTTLYSSSTVFTEIFKPKSQVSQKIEPTKTLTEDEAKMLSSSFYSESTIVQAEEKSTDLPSVVLATPTVTMNLAKEENESRSAEKKETKVTFVETKAEEKEVEMEKKAQNITNQDSTLESIISDINAIEKAVNSPSNSFTSSPSNLPAESIFLRLANRIKNLEINMSLSSTYLEELSRRYRVQLELLSKTLNLTIQKIEEHSKIEEEKERRREKEMLLFRMQLANLTRDVSNLVREKNSWKPRASSISQHIFFISIEVLLVWILFSYWKKPVESKNFLERTEGSKKISKRSNRRNSLEGVKGHEIPRRKMRRPSEEAMDIALSRNFKGDLIRMEKKRKKRKKESKAGLNGVSNKIKSSNNELHEINSRHSSNVEKPNITSAPEELKPDTIPYNLLHPDNIEVFNRFEPIAVDKSTSHNVVSTLSEVSELASPAFMKTAVASRNSRLKLSLGLSSSQDMKSEKDWLKKETQKERKSSNSLKKYVKKFF